MRFMAVVAAALRWSLIAAVAIMLACIALQVVMRYVFGNALSWSEELALLMFSWAALGGLALGVREGFHVRLTLLLEPLPGSARVWAERAIQLLTAALGAYLVWSGWRYVDITRGGSSAAIAYPIELLHGIAPLAGLFVLIFAVEGLLYPKRA
jgi:TRAP-type C4-dicarboxylate transport system permease small subunit